MRIIALFLFFVGLHTYFTVAVAPGIPVPNAICLFAAALGCIHLGIRKLIRQALREWRMGLFLIFAILVTLFSVQSGYAAKSFRGVLQLMYAFALGLVLITLMEKSPREVLGRGALLLIIAIAFSAALEALGPLKALSDAFRQYATPNWFYDVDNRDIDIHGRIRSKVFSPEPSTAAISLYCLSMILLWGSRLSVRLLLAWLIAMMISLWAIGSPIVAISILVGLATVAVWLLEGIYRRRRWILLLGALSLVACAMTILVTVLVIQMRQRIEQIQEGDISFTLRVTGSAEFTSEFVRRHPAVGIGVVGDVDMLVGELREFYVARGDRWIAQFEDEVVKKMISNNVFIHFIYWGGFGGMFAGLLLLSAIKIKSILLKFLVLVQLSVLWMTLGGYNTPTIWCLSAAIVVMGRSFNEHNRRVGPQELTAIPDAFIRSK